MSLADVTDIATVETAPPALDVERIRADFPILRRQVHGKPLVYLDNAASSQKPRAVIETVREFYEDGYANIHRGVHHLSERATKAYEDARKTIQQFLNAASTKEIVYVSGTTEAINLVASSYVRKRLREGDEILITHMEHHSNIVPWQMLCEETGANLRVAPIDDSGTLILDEFEKLLTEKTRFVAVAHVSNSLGTINPLKKIVQLAHERGARVLVDGAQATPHMKVDVQDLGCDFYAFSGHKTFGPTGVGALYGKAELLEEMAPYQGGGDMIRSVSFEKTTYNDIPFKFEAGTPNIAGGIGFGAALDYTTAIGLDAIAAYENDLLAYATQAVSDISGVRIIGQAVCKAAVLSFVLDRIHPHDIGTILDREGVAIRTGHHCTQPVMDRFDVPATARASFAFYNTKEDIDALVRGLKAAIEVFS